MIALCSHAPAQTLTGGWTINVSNTVSPSQPIAEIEVWAWFDPGAGGRLLFAVGDFDLIAADGRLERPELALGIRGQPGTPAGSAVTGVFAYQLHIPPFMTGNPDNPIHVWSVFWETTDFTPRTVSLNTMNTTQFTLVEDPTGNLHPLYPQGFTPGSTAITVIPAPASALVLLAPLLAVARRTHRA